MIMLKQIQDFDDKPSVEYLNLLVRLVIISYWSSNFEYICISNLYYMLKPEMSQYHFNEDISKKKKIFCPYQYCLEIPVQL